MTDSTEIESNSSKTSVSVETSSSKIDTPTITRKRFLNRLLSKDFSKSPNLSLNRKDILSTPLSHRKLSIVPSDNESDKLSTKSDNEVELRRKVYEVKIEKRTSFKLIKNSLKQSFRINRSKSCGEAKDVATLVEFERKVKSNSIGHPPPQVQLPCESVGSNEDGDTDLEEPVKHISDPALLNGSSGNFGSAGAKSAPSTPQGIFTSSNLSLGVGAGHAGGLVINTLGTASNSDFYGGTISQPCTPGCRSPSIQRSPSHSVFSKSDKSSLKSQSPSNPQMTAQGQVAEPPSPKNTKEVKVRTTSKSHQKKFKRHFQNVNEEDVLNHYVCALIGDILLQGHLYITKNYFAFYSNVFGYVTKLLIPIISVTDITKEKTARIIPNAVGIHTSEDKHVFGSLMSRDTTLQYMKEVWEKAKTASPVIIEPVNDQEVDSSESGESGRESPQDEEPLTFKKCENIVHPVEPEITDIPDGVRSENLTETIKRTISLLSKLPRQSLLLYISTFLLILMFFSAGILLYRIGQIQDRYSIALQDSRLGGGEDMYSNLLQWQSHLHSKSADAVTNFLDNNLDQIAKVRQSLEALSTLLISNSSPLKNAQSTSSTNEQTPSKS